MRSTGFRLRFSLRPPPWPLKSLGAKHRFETALAIAVHALAPDEDHGHAAPAELVVFAPRARRRFHVALFVAHAPPGEVSLRLLAVLAPHRAIEDDLRRGLPRRR